MEEYDTSDIIKILVAASELSLQELIPYLQSFLIENKTNWMELNFDLIYQTSFENDSFLELQKYCTDLMSKEPDKIFKSLNFSSIPEKLLVSVIQSDNLQMSEVQVWEHVLKWGLAQNPGLPSDPTSFSEDEFNALGNTLKQCIPFIRFYNLTSKEFLNKVIPYRKILPEDLFMDLLKDFLDRDSMPSDKSKPRIAKEINSINIDSKVITFQHAELILKWIDKLNITDKLTSSYEFKLLLRGSRDGFTPNEFHRICDNQSNTITIIKVKGTSEILGGYNPIAWKSIECYGQTRDSFIFSFKDKENTENYILSRVKNEVYAIGNFSNCGPVFGRVDLVLHGSRFYHRSFCGEVTYEKLIRETTFEMIEFSVEEYEVFQIIKN